MTGDYKVNTIGDKTVLMGSMRLKSPISYDKPLQTIKEALEEGNHTLDVTELELLNSSGVSAIARLCLLSRDKKNVLTVIMSKDHPWQDKTFQSLKFLTKETPYLKVEES